MKLRLKSGENVRVEKDFTNIFFIFNKIEFCHQGFYIFYSLFVMGKIYLQSNRIFLSLVHKTFFLEVFITSILIILSMNIYRI